MIAGRELTRRSGYRGLSVAAALALALVACGGDSPTSTELWCEGLCTTVQRCGFQDPACLANCVNQRPGLANLSTSGAAAEKPCLAQLTCAALSNDAAWSDQLDACWQQAKLSVSASERVRQFCPAHALAWFDCGYTLSVDDCARSYGMWSDAVVNKVALCDAKQSCDEFQACEKSVFDNL